MPLFRFAAIALRLNRIDGKRIGAIAGDLAAVEEMFALKELMAKLGSVNIATQDSGAFDPKLGRASYIFNPTIVGIEQADALLIVGSNPRKEAPVLNARIRKRWRTGALKIGVVGEKVDLTYGYEHLGAGAETLAVVATADRAVGSGVDSRLQAAAPMQRATVNRRVELVFWSSDLHSYFY